nr:CMF_HP1_G0048330.mRNA.1.CDS.1 [Saccharomyces cerevisiae]
MSDVNQLSGSCFITPSPMRFLSQAGNLLKYISFNICLSTRHKMIKNGNLQLNQKAIFVALFPKMRMN